MRNQLRKPKNVNCANSFSFKQTILGVKCAERGDKHFAPTSFEQLCNMNLKQHYNVGTGRAAKYVIPVGQQFAPQYFS